jgi:hypothetical protein
MVGIAQPATSIGQRETALRWAAFVCDRDQGFAVPLAREDTPEADRVVRAANEGARAGAQRDFLIGPVRRWRLPCLSNGRRTGREVASEI